MGPRQWARCSGWVLLAACRPSDGNERPPADATDADTDSDSDTDVDTGEPTPPSTCGTTIDEVADGDLVITEIFDSFFLNDPPSDSSVQKWLELQNTSAETIDLHGLLVVTDGWLELDKDSDTVEVLSELCVEPGGLVVLGATADLEKNGGAPVDYAWGDSEVLLSDEDSTTQLRDRRGRVLDEVAIPDPALVTDTSWPEPLFGLSLALDPSRATPAGNDDPFAWCPATTPFGLGSLGTPGEPNLPCVPRLIVSDLQVGDLVITEVFADPTAVEDSVGQWIEVYNTRDTSIDLNGLMIKEYLGDEPEFPLEQWYEAIARTAIVPPNAPFVLGFLDASDPLRNGGAPVAAQFYVANLFGLEADTLVLSVYDEGYRNIDVVTFDAALGWPLGPGVAMQLDAALTDATANDNVSAWCAAVQPFGLGDLGTPGFVNDGC